MEQQIIHDAADYISAAKIIKDAILKSRYRAAQKVNHEMLALYYGIGGFISYESRTAKWGTGAIKAISRMLKQELPGLRGFSESNIKRMRQFYEAWSPYFINRPFETGDLTLAVSDKAITIRPLATGELAEQDLKAFLSVGFTLHDILLGKTKTLDERLFYIRLCAEKLWDADELKYHLDENLYRNNCETSLRKHLQGIKPHEDESRCRNIPLRPKIAAVSERFRIFAF